MSPHVRDGHVMATVGDKVVLFGGEYFSGTAFVPLGDTWLWDGTNWAPVNGTGPDARFYSAMATLGGQAVLFGGTGNAPDAQTWIFNGSSWMKLNISNGPSARCGEMMATR